MEFICRQCARRAQVATFRPRKPPSLRPFSSSPPNRRSAAVPSFEETSSADLNNVLSTLRNDIFLPAYLSRGQQHQVFRNRYRSQLENSDSTVVLGDEEFPLRPMNSQKIQRDRKKVITQALELIVANGEWRQLMPLLEGVMVIRNISLEEAIKQFIGDAAQRGHLGVVMTCLIATKRTGLSLKDKHVYHSVLRGLRQTSESEDWKAKAVKAAIQHSHRFAKLLVEKQHKPSQAERMLSRKTVRFVPVRDPYMIAGVLEPRAVYAYRYTNGKDEDGSVKKYYNRLVTVFGPSALAEARRQQLLPTGVLDFEFEFFEVLSLWHGAVLARKMLDPQVMKRYAAFDEFVDKCAKALARSAAVLAEKQDKTANEEVALREYELAKQDK